MKKKIGRPPAGPEGAYVRDFPQLTLRMPPDVLRKFRALCRMNSVGQPEMFMKLFGRYLKSMSSSDLKLLTHFDRRHKGSHKSAKA